MSLVVPGRPSLLSYGLGGVMLAGMAFSVTASVAADATSSMLGAQPMTDGSNWQPVPIDTGTPFFDIDWSVGFTGTYTHQATSPDHFQELILPSVTLTHTGSTLSYNGSASGQLSRTDDGPVNLENARLAGGMALQFDPTTSLATDVSVSKSQEDVLAPDVADDVASTPVEYTGSADATLTQNFGRINVSSGLTLGRSVYGPTTLTDASQIDNSGQNNTSVGGSLRLGFDLTPVLEVFGKADVTRSVFDAPVASLATKLDGNLYTVQTGVVGTWGDLLTAQASVGEAYEHFDSAGLSDVAATLYDASFSYKPVSTLALAGDFSTSVGAPGPNGSGSAEITYAAAGTATYTVNDWLDWRGSAGWHSSTFAGTAATDRGYSLGAGADYLISRHAKVSADYSFVHSDISTSAPTDTQAVSVGFTLQK